MTIATYKDEDKTLLTSGTWHFLLTGEWSQSPYHQGKVAYKVREFRYVRTLA